MHAFLVITNDEQILENEIQKITTIAKAVKIDIGVQTIAECRELIHINSIHHPTLTAYVIKDIDTSSVESQNAILKILEEPQKNIIFILTSHSEENLLPTIISRCLVISPKPSEQKIDLKTEINFPSLSQGQQLSKIAKIKTRDQALLFLDSLAKSAHQSLAKGNDMANLSKNILQTMSLIKKNAHLQIQLTKFVINNF